MGAAAATAALLLLVPSSASYRLNVNVSNSTEGGLVAVAPGQPSRPSVSTTLSPSTALQIGTNNLALSLSYNLRLFRRFEFGEPDMTDPNTLAIPEIPRFLLNHTVSMGTDFRFARGWTFSLVGSASLGEVDSPAATGLLGGGDPTLGNGQNGGGNGTGQGANQGMGAPGLSQGGIGGVPTDDGVVDALTMNASARFGGQLSADYAFELGASLSHTRSLTGTSTSAILQFAALPEQTNLGLSTQLSFNLGRRDSVSVGAGVEFSYTGQGGGSFRNLSGTIGYGRRLGRTTSMAARLGVFAIQVLDAPEFSVVGVLAQDSVSPLLDFSLDFTVLQLRSVIMAGAFGASVAGTANPVTGTIEPRATSSLNLGISLPPSANVGLSATFSAPAAYGDREVDVDMAGGQAFVDAFLVGETTFESAATFTYSVSSGFDIGSGIRFSTFAPRFGAQNFGFSNQTYTVFVTASLGASQLL